MRYSAESQLNTIESNAPPSKRDILKPIYEVIDKEKKRAHENWLDWMRRQDEACSCGRGSYC